MEFVFGIFEFLYLGSGKCFGISCFLPFADRFKKLFLKSAFFNAFVYAQQIACIKGCTSRLYPFHFFGAICSFALKPPKHAGHVIAFKITLILYPVIDLALP